MKKLKVDIDDIAFTMETTDDLYSVVLFDTETGEIVNIPNELMNAVESGVEEMLEDMPEWEKEIIELAESIVSDEKGRFVDIPRKPSFESYDLMVEFASSVNDKRLKGKLEKALDGKKPFRRFKDVLMDYPDEEKRWFAFKDGKMREEAIEWLNSIGIEPVDN